MVRKASKRAKPRTHSEEISLKIAAFGPTPASIQALVQGLATHRRITAYLGKSRHRLLQVDLVEPVEETKPTRPRPPDRFRAIYYDYTHNRSVFVTGRLRDPTKLEIAESAFQPLPSSEEFDEAVTIVMKHPELGVGFREQRVRAYPPMPPLVLEELPDGRVERVIAVGIAPNEGMRGHEIVGVNMISRNVIRYERSERGCAPITSAAHNPICGITSAAQATARSVAGSVWVTVTQGGNTVWKFLVVRPAASSGTNGSGVELRYVDYRGKRVLYRAHVPILNVKYDRDACGPYRDWQNQEGMIQASGSDPAPGFRLCSSPAQTIIDSGSDVGTFLGVGIYVQEQEVVLVSEMEAGWYRYVSMWRLHTDGTIRPRFGFSAVTSSCVCNVHHHHAYWRLDFDIRTAGNNLVREFNDPPIIAGKNWHDKNFEIRRPRDPAHKRKWRVENKSTGEAYDIIPEAHDGVATTSTDWPFPRGDVWVLRYHGAEIDDGIHAIGPPYEANIDAWVNGEAVNGEDVVIWYGAHFTHDVQSDPPGQHGHIVGPDLKLVKW